MTLVTVGQSVDGRGGVVVDGVARSWGGFASGEVYAFALVSRMRSHHRHPVVAFSQEHTQRIQFALDGRVPLLGAGRCVHVVVRLIKLLKLLFGHHNTSVFSFFQFGSFFSGAFVTPSDLHSLDASNSTSSVVRGVHCRPPLLGETIFVIRELL